MANNKIKSLIRYINNLIEPDFLNIITLIIIKNKNACYKN